MSDSTQSSVAARDVERQDQKVKVHQFLIHHKGDHVGVAVTDIRAGEKAVGVYMDDDSTIEVEVKHDVPLGHKIALASLKENEPVLKYGIPIGVTTCKWEVGDYVHTHNIKTARW
ncbi:MAG: UxaA family hydrolase [Novibacillus thermophilus]|jgi:(2R)-sulfolactate sulfo-lyase subunit alpha|uniref:UxaA family hydrolase n=1 Tax=Novibacillus thermophilus TaxID=1471761 RepID=UPI00098A4017|nr:UxaA family hydrolase [Novibacillus thermophilus]